jgi:alkylation response protein AidB-like acyl-CoA dehydrogenase
MEPMDAHVKSVTRQAQFRRFALEHIAPHADAHDRTQRISDGIVARLAEQGYLAPFLPPEWGGASMDMVTYGALHEEVGRACSSVRSLLTVHDMASFTIFRWGSEAQRRKWLGALSRGDVTGAFAISEPNAGSDVNGIETTAEPTSEGFRLEGQKKWITFGQIAGLFVVLTRCDGRPTAFLIERDTPGFTIEPIFGVTGTRGSMLAALHFRNCHIPKSALIGRAGFGANPVALSALGLGRYSVACGSLGIAQACLDSCFEYVNRTHRFGVALKEHQLIQQMITQMITDTSASRLLCRLAGALKDDADPQEIMQTFIAKYHASTAAMRAADNAVQIHGANGCSQDYPVERYMRDAKVMEIIEGSTQIQQITIASLGLQDFERQRASATSAASAPAIGQMT